MEKIRKIQWRYCFQALLVAVIAAIVCIILGQKTIAKGLLLGAIFSTINFNIMAKLNPLKLGKSKYKAGSFASISIFLRLGILSIPLVFSIKSASINFFAVVIGLFFVQLMIMLDHFVVNRLPVVRKI